MLLKDLCDCLNSIPILIHLCLLCSIMSYSTEDIHFCLCFPEYSLFPLYPCLLVLKFCTLYVQFCMSCDLDLQQICPKRLYVFFTFLFWLVLCFFCILSSGVFETNHFLYDAFFASMNHYIWSSHILKYFLLLHIFSFPKLSCAADFRMSYEFCHSFSTTVSFAFILFKLSFTLCVYSHLILSLLNSLILKISSCFINSSFCFHLANKGGNLLCT